ncbi:MAG: DUF1800 family protein, partial [Planctomycetota bacterium]
QKVTAEFVAAKIFRTFVHTHPSDATVRELGDVLRGANYEIAPLLRTLFKSREFYSERAMGTRIKGPVELVVGLYRTLDLKVPDIPLLALTAQFLGQSLMEPPNVKGWDGGRDWITTSHLLNRYNAMSAAVGQPVDRVKMAGRRVPGRLPQIEEDPEMRAGGGSMDGMEMEGMDEGEMRERRRREREIYRQRRRRMATEGYDPVAEIRRRNLRTAGEIVDHFTGRLLAARPSPEMRARSSRRSNATDPSTPTRATRAPGSTGSCG